MRQHKHNIAFSIISTARRLTTIAEEYFFKPMKLSNTSIQILRILRHQKSASLNEIVEIMRGNKSNISQRVDTLERQGFLKQVFRVNPKDMRKSEISLTDLGMKKIKEIENKMRKAQVHLEKIFSQRELQDHFAFFEKINRVLDEKEECIKKFLK